MSPLDRVEMNEIGLYFLTEILKELDRTLVSGTDACVQ